MQFTDNYQQRHPIFVRAFIVLVLILVSTLFFAFDRFEPTSSKSMNDIISDFEGFEIPPNTWVKPPPKQTRPQIPIAGDDEEVPRDVTIEPTGLTDLYWEAPPIMVDPSEKPIFIAHDQAPLPIGGYGALASNVTYPEMARQAGIEGTVRVQAYIDEKGFVRNTVVLEGIPNSGLNDAAERAIRRTRFSPAYQRDRKVAVWITIPIVFSLGG